MSNDTITHGRRRRREKSFVTIENSMFEDARLSWKAKGLLGYLLTKPDGWKVIRADLIKHSTDGDSAIRSALKELQRYGYLAYRRIKEKGKFVGIVWEYDDVPFFDAEEEEEEEEIQENQGNEPHVDFPHLEDKQMENHTDISNKDFNNTDLSNKEIKDIVNKDLKSDDLLNMINDFYQEFAPSRWSKERWLTIAKQLTSELVDEDGIFRKAKNPSNYIKGCLKRIAHHHDRKTGKKEFTYQGTKIPLYNWLES
jgi:hypothetical protein